MTATHVVHQYVRVIIDRKKFTQKFMREFRESFYKFNSIDEHLAHLAQLYARGLAHNDTFIEGYGNARGMGIKFESAGMDVEKA